MLVPGKEQKMMRVDDSALGISLSLRAPPRRSGLGAVARGLRARM